MLAWSVLTGQTKSPFIDKTLADADSLERIGAAPDALLLYDGVLSRDPKNVTAHFGAGRTYMTQGLWLSARDEFDAILEIKPNDLVAHYDAAVCNIQADMAHPFLRRRDKASKHLEYIIRQDSLYEDVFNQYALVFFQERDYTKAFELGRLQVKLKPDGAKSYVGLFKLYRMYLPMESESTVEEYLSSQPTDLARYELGEFMRRKGDLDRAENAFKEILKRASLDIPRQPVLLSLARVLYASGLDAEAERCFWEAVNGSTSVGQLRFVYEDLKYIMSPGEVRLFRSIEMNLEDQKSFYRVFWMNRNPDITAALNKRLGEHYRRLNYAEKNYECFIYHKVDILYQPEYLSQPREYIGESVIVNYASYCLNTEYDDRGYVYIRYGEPDGIYRTPGEDIPPNLTWLYNPSRNNDKLIFEFHLISTPHNEWRMGLPILEKRILEDRLALDLRYYDLQQILSSGRKDLLAVATEKTKEEFRASAAVALTTERHVSEEKIEDLAIAASTTTYRGSDKRSLLDLAIGIPLQPLSSLMTDSMQNVKLKIAVQVHDRSGRLQWSAVDTSHLSVIKNTQNTIAQFYRMSVLPDSYKVRLQVDPLGYKIRGIWTEDIRVEDFSKPGLMMSDIEFLLPSRGRSTMEVEGIRVMPSPFERIGSNQMLRTYLQIYNLTLGVTNRTDCSIVYEFKRREQSEGLVGTVISIFKSRKKASLVTKLEAQGKESMLAQYMPFPLEQFEPGQYTLTVKVTDKRTDKNVERSRSIEIYEVK